MLICIPHNHIRSGIARFAPYFATSWHWKTLLDPVLTYAGKVLRPPVDYRQDVNQRSVKNRPTAYPKAFEEQVHKIGITCNVRNQNVCCFVNQLIASSIIAFDRYLPHTGPAELPVLVLPRGTLRLRHRPFQLTCSYACRFPARHAAFRSPTYRPPFSRSAAAPLSPEPNSSPALQISHESASKSRRMAAISARRCRGNSSSSGQASVRIALAISSRACNVCGTALKVRGSGGFIFGSLHSSLPAAAPKRAANDAGEPLVEIVLVLRLLGLDDFGGGLAGHEFCSPALGKVAGELKIAE